MSRPTTWLCDQTCYRRQIRLVLRVQVDADCHDVLVVSVALREERPAVVWRPVVLCSALFAVALVAVSDAYGYHRDELYFLAIGKHAAFGYVDQPPLVPLLAHALDVVGGHSLLWLRLPSAVAGAFVVLVTALIAREFGGGGEAQLLAAVAMATSGVLVGASHLMSTTVFDLLAWTVLLWLAVRALRDGGRIWLLVGLVAGVSLEVKTLPLFLLFALAAGVALGGPRAAFRSRWLWFGAAIAAVLWAPNLIWQATHHWPQLTLSASIAAGHSGSSQPRALFVPFQFLLLTPPLAPVWIAGWWRLARGVQLTTWRCVPIAYLVLTVVFVATGGKPYYLCGMYPVLFAAGAEPTLTWLRSRRRIWRNSMVAAVALSAAVSAVVALPTLPASRLPHTPVLAMNYDAGEQVGWQRFADTVAKAYDDLQPLEREHAAVLAANYGEAGAMMRYRPAVRTWGGQNSMWDLGPPPADTTTVIAIGYRAADLRAWFQHIEQVAVIDNGVGVANDEQGQPVWRCTNPTTSWSGLWPEMKRLG